MLLIIDRLLDAPLLERFHAHLAQARWIDGRASAGSLAASVKTNEQVADDDETAIALGNHLLRLLGQHPQFISAALPERIHSPRFNRYRNGGSYGSHVDSAIMRVGGSQASLRSDLSATVFLTDPDAYEGGELQIETAFGAQSVKLAAGDMVLYPSSSLHRVTPVTRGSRVCAIFWLQSLVRDPGDRALLFDLDQSIQAITSSRSADDPALLGLTSVYHNLLRRWAMP
jgi:PKHD-type hydroxylase